MSVVALCSMKDTDGLGYWEKQITFPFPPYPGLNVGAHGKIKKVWVCDVDRDGVWEVEVRLGRTRILPAILEFQGWKWHSR